ncbi:MAG TPA: proton-conducting transporter membrane subunit [Candidatus Goldiibacteriota bacterium]|nr:proton-conducting transporter membrane subunit [Candidatus Goldiibacteriota bacterium]
MAEIILLATVPLAALIFFSRSRVLNNTLLILYSAGFVYGAFTAKTGPGMLSPYIEMDGLGKLFLCIMSCVFFAAMLYNFSYPPKERESEQSHAKYSAAVVIFAGSMAAFVMSAHLALAWVFIEATTLASTYLIYYSGTKNSLEASWKYIFICSIGISLAFIGIVFLSLATGKEGTLFFSQMQQNAAAIDGFWLKIAFVFILTGFGTKAGLAPVHAWLPDAHSEAPSPVSAMLSGALLNTAMLGIMRVFKIMKLAGYESFASALILVMGFFSLIVAAVFVSRVKNYKRMMAYSSIENMGIMAIGAATGGLGAIAALIHAFSHSFLKSAFFMTAGNMLKIYHTGVTAKTGGLLRKNPLLGWLFLILFAALSAVPPSPSFLSEYLIVAEMVKKGGFYAAGAAVFLLLIAFVVYGMAKTVFFIAYGKDESPEENVKLPFMLYAPVILLLAAAAGAALIMPQFLSDIFKNAIDCM